MIFAGSIASVRFSVTQNRRSARQRLEVVHPVGDRGAADGFVDQVEVPARPVRGGAAAAARVGVQDGLVALVGDRAEHSRSAVARVGEHSQRLVGVGGDDDLVEALRAAVAGDLDSSG